MNGPKIPYKGANSNRELFHDCSQSMNFYVFPSITQVFILIPKRTGPIRPAQARNQIENVEKGAMVQSIQRVQDQGNRKSRQEVFTVE